MINDNSQNQETNFWICNGEEKNLPHPPQMLHYGDECPICHNVKKIKRNPPPPNPDTINITRPTDFEVPPEVDTNSIKGTRPTASQVSPTGQKSKRDWPLVGALTILNLGSAFTTVRGASQILPSFVAYPMGITIQGVLFALIARLFLKHAPLIKWVVVGCFSTFSVYTSFFAYYDLLNRETREKTRIELANSGHQSLVGEFFTPIQNKVNSLESEIGIINKKIEKETQGERGGRPKGCGKVCQQLKEEREILEEQKAQLKPLVNRLQPLFNYNVEGKSPKEIFDTDFKALSKVGENCLPKELLSQLEITCLPDQYLKALNPQNSENYERLRLTYIDPDLEVDFLAPILKVMKGEGSAIASVIMALLIDGCIILLGIGVEIRPQVTRQRQQTLTLQIKDGKIVEFLNLLLSKSENETIEIEKSDNNKDEYQNLLTWLSVNTRWIWQDEDKSWYFRSSSSKENFQKWLINQINLQNQARASTNLLESWKKKPPEYFVLEMPIVSKDQD
ncbi:hypothetical protein Tery_1900 [Trichodesmium erythraeum IMS101]|uniref:Uncharacterized protein n=1 Tax=Trichodesmium erythraeum (strain IMS101) TaxID=203124 RepID=Q114B9_TRIEI|nr:hypothetical protein [Trichodesmium erythraeum GBRTRLIN201]